MEIGGYPFRLEGALVLDRDETGAIRRYMPQGRYRNAATVALHKYGSGPFCGFRLPTNAEVGVYAFIIGGVVMYIGRCRDALAIRINNGYGHISPRHCYKGGREPNCRINHLILLAAERGAVVEVWFHPCDPPDELEVRLIDLAQPPWNLAGVCRGLGARDARDR